MKKRYTLALYATLSLAGLTQAMAGNDTKRGQGGASELLINPWARSTGMAGSNTSFVKGIESMNTNIGGLFFTQGTDINFTTINYLSGAGINISSVALGQRLGESGAMGVSMTSVNMGDLLETTTLQPDGTGNKIRPSMFNIGLAYSRKFSREVTGGLLVRLVSQSIPNAGATGVAFDAGVQWYKRNVHLGVSVRNLGPKLSYDGDGFIYNAQITSPRNDYSQSSKPVIQSFEMPALFNIAAAYDLKFGSIVDSTDGDSPIADHRLTPAVTFVSNSYTQDQFLVGLEYSFRDMVMIRGGYNLQKNVFNTAELTDINAGPTAGATFQVPLSAIGIGNDDNAGEGKRAYRRKVGFDYSYRSTKTFNGTHSIGIVLTL